MIRPKRGHLQLLGIISKLSTSVKKGQINQVCNEQQYSTSI